MNFWSALASIALLVVPRIFQYPGRRPVGRNMSDPVARLRAGLAGLQYPFPPEAWSDAGIRAEIDAGRAVLSQLVAQHDPHAVPSGDVLCQELAGACRDNVEE